MQSICRLRERCGRNALSVISLSLGKLDCQIDPALGGAVLGLHYGGRPFLRPTVQGTKAVDSACFAMLPYCNRIVGGAVRLGKHAWPIKPNFGMPPAPCHGDGWQSAWTICDLTASSALLSLTSRAVPYAYRAEQCFELDSTGLRISMSIVNRGEITMPFGLGIHPYFPDPQNATVRFAAQRFWLEGPDRLPTEPISLPPELDAAAGLRISPHWRNNCYDGWDGKASIDWNDGRTLQLAGSGFEVLHLFRPEAQDFFCLEAQSHVSGAMGWPDGTDYGIVALAPGASMAASLMLSPSLR